MTKLYAQPTPSTYPPNHHVPEPQPDIYVEFPNEYIAPAQITGRKSGNYIHVLLWGAPPYHRLQWTQWVSTDDLRTEQELTQ